MPSRTIRKSHVLIAVAFSTCLMFLAGPVQAMLQPATFDSLVAVDFSRVRLTAGDIARLDVQDLEIVRGVIFGRHGRVFRAEPIRLWLESQPWYRPDPSFTNASLNDIERANLDLVREFEARDHDRIEPGDLRWWQDRRMTADSHGSHTRIEWAVLRAEVEAVHGRRFDERWLQRYFDERYWYRADSTYDAGRLSEIERRNLALIDSLSRDGVAQALVPGDMGMYEARPVAMDLLRGSDLFTLRVLRNEIYARHGMRFRPRAMNEWFAQQEWYEPRDSFEVRLSFMEQRNVATIDAYERSLHDSLRTRVLEPSLIEGLLAEDARRLRLEIYARHGRVFLRRWEQDYVASLPGYHPDPSYTDARLSEVERANIAAIAEYEKTAPFSLFEVEG